MKILVFEENEEFTKGKVPAPRYPCSIYLPMVIMEMHLLQVVTQGKEPDIETYLRKDVVMTRIETEAEMG